MSAAAGLRVGWLVEQFPSWSETFLLRQMTGLIDRGVDLTIVALRRGDLRGNGGGGDGDDAGHDLVRRYGLVERARFGPTIEPGVAGRASAVAERWREQGVVRGGVAMGRSLWPGAGAARLGRRAWTLRPFVEAGVWRGLPRFDVVVASYGPLGAAAAEWRRRGVCEAGALVTFFRGYDVGRVLRATPGRYRRLFRPPPIGGDRFLAVSEDLAAALRAAGCEAPRLEVLRGGVDLAESEAVRPPTREPGQATRLLSVCRLVEKKGLEVALEALGLVAEAGREFHYEIVGDGPRRGELERAVRRWGLAERVTLAGWRDQSAVRAALRGCHLVLCPSVTSADGDREGVPNIVKEALAMRRPVVATRHGGIPEAVEDGVGGRLVAERDPVALADAILELIDQPQRWEVMGEAGRAGVEARFDLEKLNDRLAEILVSVARGAGERRVGASGVGGVEA